MDRPEGYPARPCTMTYLISLAGRLRTRSIAFPDLIVIGDPRNRWLHLDMCRLRVLYRVSHVKRSAYARVIHADGTAPKPAEKSFEDGGLLSVVDCNPPPRTALRRFAEGFPRDRCGKQ